MPTLRIKTRDALKGLSPEGLGQLLQAASDQLVCLENLRATLTAAYPWQWVAAVDSRIVGPAATADDLVAQLRAQGIDPAETTFAYLDPDQKGLILWREPATAD